MTSIDIYSILANKPHNSHYLKRYIRFIDDCSRINSNSTEFLIKHHICPKANDMFPEFSSFKENLWNRAELTPRQHLISHWILWKTFNCKSQTKAFYMLSHKDGLRISSKIYEILTKATIEISKGPKSKEHGENISKAKKGIIYELSKETRYEIGSGARGKKWSSERILEHSLRVTGDGNGMFGKPGPNLGKTFSTETREKLKGPKSEIHKTNLRIAQQNRDKDSYARGPRLNARKPQEQCECPHCLKIGGKNLMVRYHFDNCKFKPLQIP